MKHAEERRTEWWQLMLTEVRGRLARIDRGETVAPSDRHVRVWRVLVAPEARR